jgi:hypothetical protein
MAPVPRGSSEQPPTRELLLRRFLAVLLALIFVVGGPVARQVFGSSDRHLARWIMFRTIGLSLVDARFYRRDPGGQLVRVPRIRRNDARAVGPREPERLTTYEEVEAAARDLCVALGPGADLRIFSRVATEQGWLQQLGGEENFCAAFTQAEQSAWRTDPGGPGRDTL